MTDREDGSGPPNGPSDAGDAPREERPSGVVGWLKWFWTTDKEVVLYMRDVVTSVAAVLAVGLILFAISGIWPPMVAIESGSMVPNMEKGDLVFVVDNERFVPEEAPVHEGKSTGVIPADTAREVGHTEFNGYGDVIVFMPNGDPTETPVIHRSMLWVEDGENWVQRTDPQVSGSVSCDQVRTCPAPHAGFVTLGDANPNYDQIMGVSTVVKPEWIIGTAEARIPYLGYVRLQFSGMTAPADTAVAASNHPTPPEPTVLPARPAGGGQPTAA
ncbi:MAG: S26 family signal peptidase [Natronomonas sp.]